MREKWLNHLQLHHGDMTGTFVLSSVSASFLRHSKYREKYSYLPCDYHFIISFMQKPSALPSRLPYWRGYSISCRQSIRICIWLLLPTCCRRWRGIRVEGCGAPARYYIACWPCSWLEALLHYHFLYHPFMQRLGRGYFCCVPFSLPRNAIVLTEKPMTCGSSWPLSLLREKSVCSAITAPILFLTEKCLCAIMQVLPTHTMCVFNLITTAWLWSWKCLNIQ